MIYLMRHGLDDESYIGGYSNVELTDEGIIQVKDKIKYISNLNINRIVCSDVLRAKQTSSIISDKLKLPVYVDKALRELDKGLLNGMEKEKAKELYPRYFETLSIYDKYPEGESMLEMYRRIEKLLASIEEYNDSLLVTHRGVINMIYFILNDIPLDMNKTRFNVVHASIHELNYKEKKIRRIY